MKDVIQIKTELVQFQHDALIAFYQTYPRLIVNKLLLRLCEGCLRMYPPTLADFIVTAPQPHAERRAVVIRISKAEFPEVWQFYVELPYGARAHVMLNIMNRHAQLAETDRTVLESAYWRRPEEQSSAAPGLGAGTQHREEVAAQPAVPAAAAVQPPAPVSSQVEAATRPAPETLVPIVPEQSEPDDPLASFKVSL